MRIFVTGITGFVGGTVANYFASLGHSVSGIGRSNQLPKRISERCCYKQADICKPLEYIDADIVIHAAGLASDTAPSRELYCVNVNGTRNVLNACKKVRHIIHISSSSVYDFKKYPMEETQAGINFNNLSDYGKSKFEAEKYIISNSYDLKKTILRPRAIYGRHDHSLLPRLMKLVKGNQLLLPQQLSKKISLTHIDNLLHAIELCVSDQTKALKLFNVADEEVYDLYQVLTTLLPMVAGKKLKTLIIPSFVFNLFVAFNNSFNLSRTFNRFAVSSLTNTATLSINKIKYQMNYAPLKNFYNSYKEIIDWVHNEEDWKQVLKSPRNLSPAL
jgi:nucleoside-diphosphate-sugar epimerase